MFLKQMVKVGSKQYYCIVGEDRKVRVQENRGQKGYRRQERKGQGEGVLKNNNNNNFINLLKKAFQLNLQCQISKT